MYILMYVREEVVQTPRFITVEGGEGVGKSSFLKRLHSELESKGLDIIVTYEPGGTDTADAMRSIFKNPSPEDPLLPEAELFLVSAARSQHIGKKLIPAIKKGKWILCDRFYDSTRVYQGIMNNIPEEKYESIISASVNNFEPDLTFLLDCPIDTILERIGNRREASKLASGEDECEDRFDSRGREYHEGLKRCFLEIAEKFQKRIVVLDSSLGIDELVGRAISVLEERFGKNI